jgi:hypothetical protein
MAEMQERDTKLEDYDVEAVLNFAEHVVLNAARLWTEFSCDQKQCLQKVLFPEGVRFEDGVLKPPQPVCYSSCYRSIKEKRQIWRPYRESNPVASISDCFAKSGFYMLKYWVL